MAIIVDEEHWDLSLIPDLIDVFMPKDEKGRYEFWRWADTFQEKFDYSASGRSAYSFFREGATHCGGKRRPAPGKGVF